MTRLPVMATSRYGYFPIWLLPVIATSRYGYFPYGYFPLWLLPVMATSRTLRLLTTFISVLYKWLLVNARHTPTDFRRLPKIDVSWQVSQYVNYNYVTTYIR